MLRPSGLTVKTLILAALMIGASTPESVCAQSSNSGMSQEAKAGQRMQNKLYPQIQLTSSYNYNQDLGGDTSFWQNQFQLETIIPVPLGDNLQVLLNPLLTLNRNVDDPSTSTQFQPVQLATFVAPQYSGDFYFGLGPYIQAPASSSLNGSRQTGLGFAAGAFYTPEHWVFGVVMYNAWGIGDNLTGGPASVLNIQPSISFTTNRGWTIQALNEMNYIPTTRSTTNQLTLTAGKTIKAGGLNWLVQLGPTFMTSITPSSPKGWGAYLGLTTQFSD